MKRNDYNRAVNNSFINMFGTRLNNKNQLNKLKKERNEKIKRLGDFKVDISEISYKTLETLFDDSIGKQLTVVNRDDVKIWSSSLFALSEKEFETLLKAYTGDDEDYIKNQFKCGHFTVDFLDYMNEAVIDKDNTIKRALSIQLLAYYYRNKNGLRGGHALASIPLITDSGLEMFIVEPQTGSYEIVDKHYETLRNDGDRDFVLELWLQK